MSQIFRRNRKGSDAEIIRLNSIGLSLKTISSILNCHPTSITLRLKSLRVPPADTRRAFMEEIFSSLPAEFKEAVADHLESDSLMTIKEYVKGLMVADIRSRQIATTPSTQE